MTFATSFRTATAAVTVAVTAVLATVVVTACAADTLLTVEVDAMSLLDPSGIGGTIPAAEAELHLPSEDGFPSAALGVTAASEYALERFGVVLAGTMRLAEAGEDLDVALTLHVAPEGVDPFTTEPAARTTVLVRDTDPTEFRFAPTVERGDATFTTLRDGVARVGVRIAVQRADGSGLPVPVGVDFALSVFDARTTVRPGSASAP